MSSLFTLENIQESWNILTNPTSTSEIRNKADKNLIEFKVNIIFSIKIISN